MLARVVGKHCESGDIVVKDEFLPADVQPGDLVAVPGTGAYCRSMASNYNHVPAAAGGRGARRRGAGDRPAGDRRRPARIGCRMSLTTVSAWRCWAAAWSAQRWCGCCTSSRRPRRPDRRPAGARRHRRAPARPRPRRPAGRPGPVHHRRARPGQARRHGRRGRGRRRHRAGPHLAGRGAASRQERGHRQQGAARRGRRGAARRGRRGRRGPLLRGAVAGAIPLLRPLRESLHGDRINRVIGIVNGTTNFILSKMDATGAGFAEALEEATALGYAEADPTADVEGFDAAAKAAILASLAFHTRVARRRRAPRGHHRGHRRRHGLRQGDGLHDQAALHREPGADADGRGRSACGCTRR